MKIVSKTDITAYPLVARGKVRDIYAVDRDTLLIVTTDRMSAFDVILDDPIPYKGVILNQITLFWMEQFSPIIQNHILAVESADFPKDLRPWNEELEGRAVLVKRAKPLPVECIVRGYITGSGWKDYCASGAVCGHLLPAHLQESAKLTPPIFTPSTKAALGDHDENITLARVAELLGEERAQDLETLSLALYEAGRDYADDRGILVADTKFEFGTIREHDQEKLILIDEVLTPDSSRFWPKDKYEEGHGQPSFDKQYLRDWLSQQPWNKQPPPPSLTQDVIEKTAQKYREAFTLITGKTLDLG